MQLINQKNILFFRNTDVEIIEKLQKMILFLASVSLYIFESIKIGRKEGNLNVLKTEFNLNRL